MSSVGTVSLYISPDCDSVAVCEHGRSEIGERSLNCGTEVWMGLLLDGCVMGLFLFRGQELRRTV